MTTPFTAMTWNVENLFPPGHLISARKAVTEEEYNAKLDYLAQTILTIQPDVLALQEIGSESSKCWKFMDPRATVGREMDCRDVSQSTPAGRQAAIAWRFPTGWLPCRFLRGRAAMPRTRALRPWRSPLNQADQVAYVSDHAS